MAVIVVFDSILIVIPTGGYSVLACCRPDPSQTSSGCSPFQVNTSNGITRSEMYRTYDISIKFGHATVAVL